MMTKFLCLLGLCALPMILATDGESQVPILSPNSFMRETPKGACDTTDNDKIEQCNDCCTKDTGSSCRKSTTGDMSMYFCKCEKYDSTPSGTPSEACTKKCKQVKDASGKNMIGVSCASGDKVSNCICKKDTSTPSSTEEEKGGFLGVIFSLLGIVKGLGPLIVEIFGGLLTGVKTILSILLSVI